MGTPCQVWAKSEHFEILPFWGWGAWGSKFQSVQILLKLGKEYPYGSSMSHKKFQLSWIFHLWVMGILVPSYVVKKYLEKKLCSGGVRWPHPKLVVKCCPTLGGSKNTNFGSGGISLYLTCLPGSSAWPFFCRLLVDFIINFWSLFSLSASAESTKYWPPCGQLVFKRTFG